MVLEVDAKYIKDMLNNPDLQPNATLNRWIQGIMLFDFELRHVPAERHRGPDALSRRLPSEKEKKEAQIMEDWLDDDTFLLLQMRVHEEHGKSEEISMTWSVTEDKQEQTLRDVQTYFQTLQTPSFSSIQAKHRFLQ